MRTSRSHEVPSWSRTVVAAPDTAQCQAIRRRRRLPAITVSRSAPAWEPASALAPAPPSPSPSLPAGRLPKNAARSVLGACRRSPRPAAIVGPQKLDRGRYRFAARSDGREVGQVHVQLRAPDAAFIHDLSIAPALRGRDLGGALVRAALRLGARAGCSSAWLEAGDDGTGRLVRWYARLGFAPAGVSERGHPLLRARLGRVHELV